MNTNTKLNHFPLASAVILHFGGVPAVAKYFKISPKAVYKWSTIDPIPKERFFEMWYRNPEKFVGRPDHTWKRETTGVFSTRQALVDEVHRRHAETGQTVKRIAKDCGVSIATASRILSKGATDD